MTITCLGNVTLPSPHTPLLCLNTHHSSFCSTYGFGSSTDKKLLLDSCKGTVCPYQCWAISHVCFILFWPSLLPLFPLFFLKKEKKKEKESWKFSTNQVCFAKLITSSNLNGLSVLVESQAFFVPWKPNGTSQLKEERDQEIWLSSSFFISQSKANWAKMVVGQGGLWKISE